MTEERVINQDMLIEVILQYNAIERTLYALGLLSGESGLWSSYRAAEDGEGSLTIGEVLSRLRTDATRFLKKREV